MQTSLLIIYGDAAFLVKFHPNVIAHSIDDLICIMHTK